MDVGYQAPGAYFPYMPYPCGPFIAPVTPSQTPSVCSEPVYQIKLPDGRCASPRLQSTTPKMQLLNTSMVNACKRNNMPARVPTLAEPDIKKFFQGGLGFSDVSESGEGSIQGGPISPLVIPFQFPQVQTTPFGYQRNNYFNHYAQAEKQVQYPYFDVQGKSQNKQINPQQEQDNYIKESCLSGHCDVAESSKANQISPLKIDVYVHQGNKSTAVRSEYPQKETKVDSEKKAIRHLSSFDKKKDLISTRNDVKNDRTKKNALVRKLRKKIQHKNKSLHKTELCTHWSLTSTCKYKEKCYFAHGIEELRKRLRVGNFKTQPCVDCPSVKERCMFGSRCNYCHPGEAIRQAFGSSYFDRDYYNNLRKDFPNNHYPFGILI